ncbi:hypothetical protein BpHYR1_004174 [Brachionus plicatilis]|uniref:Uncharacterized protein n=1 Tax=Brachionus plicatilis TaxID=10195 RepID=A0A3M7P6D2_BRAPC|nr:hypothetical protein BpHYR1_004174 [Brachionus plicatilis]
MWSKGTKRQKIELICLIYTFVNLFVISLGKVLERIIFNRPYNLLNGIRNYNNNEVTSVRSGREKTGPTDDLDRLRDRSF